MIEASLREVLERVEPGARKAHKRQLLAGALDCFEERGLEATTIEDIRARAGSSIGSIYHHFGNKDGLVAALFFAAIDDQFDLVRPRLEAAGSVREALEAEIGGYLDWVTAQPRLARFLYRARAAVSGGPHGEALVERNKLRHRLSQAWLTRGIEAGEIRALPREAFLALLIGPSESYCRAWLSGHVKASPAQHVALFTEAAWRSVAA